MSNKVPNFDLIAKKITYAAPIIGRVESIKFFKDSFIKGGFTDTSFTQWESSYNIFKRGGKTMYGTGNLMQSTRVTEENRDRVIVENQQSYAAYHNDGAIITVTLKMKNWWWWQYSKFAGAVQKRKDKKVIQTKINLKRNAKAEFCKRMALLKVGTKLKIPKRQFMGDSKQLNTNMQEVLQNYISKQFENEVTRSNNP